MGLVKDFLDFRSLRKRTRRARRFKFSSAYNAGIIDRISADWQPTKSTPNAAIRHSMRLMRARSHDLAINNDYARRFIGMAKSGIIGPPGIRLMSMTRKQNGEFDTTANDKIEAAFRQWGKKGHCTVDGRLSWIDAQDLFIHELLTSGECIVRKVMGFDGNDFRFALEFLDADDVPIALTDTDRSIILGMELDQWNRPRAYHIRDAKGDQINGHLRTTRVDASEIIHAYVMERPRQFRGVPHMCSSMNRMRMLDAIEEAYVVGTRIAASKMGFLKSENSETEAYTRETASGQREIELAPGVIETIGPDEDFITFDPDYPPTNFDSFKKDLLRGIAGGLNVGYNSLANDLEGVNYSSIRWGGLDERDVWKRLQRFVIEHFCDEVFADWLPFAMTSRQVQLPETRIEKFREISWQPRGFQWVDPDKEAKGKRQQIAMGATTFTKAAAEQGTDFTENIAQLEREMNVAKSHNIDLQINDKSADQRAPQEREGVDEDPEN